MSGIKGKIWTRLRNSWTSTVVQAVFESRALLKVELPCRFTHRFGVYAIVRRSHEITTEYLLAAKTGFEKASHPTAKIYYNGLD